jgi:hypothetical protein
MATRKKLVPPNLLVAPKLYDWRYQEQLNNAQRLFYTGLTNQVNGSLPYGTYYSTITLENPTANAVNLVPFDARLLESYNTAIGRVDSRIYVAETGIYNVQFSAQANVATGGGAEKITLWLRKNGEDYPASAGKIVVNGPSSETMAAWNYVLVLSAGDYVELAWASPETHMILQAEAATDTIPSIPSVILTICWVSYLNLSKGT